MKHMRDVPHKTFIGALRDAVSRWRARHGWSREAVADEIVAYYRASAYPALLGIEFQDTAPGARDVARALETNADRVWRWLDDQTKDTTLLPLNFAPVVLEVLPADLRLSVLGEMLGPLGLVVSLAQPQAVADSHAALMAAAAKEGGEGLAAFARLAESSSLEALRCAEVELEEALDAKRQALAFVRDRLHCVERPPLRPVA